MSIMSIRKAATKMMMPVIIILAVALTVGLFYIGAPTMGNENASYNQKAVKLGNQVVKGAEFNKYLIQAGQQASQMAQYGMPMPDEGRIRDTALSMAISNLAFEAEKKKISSKIKVSNDEIEKLIKKYFPTEEEMQSVMMQQGIADKAELRKIIKKQLESQKFIAYKAKELKIKVSKSEIEDKLKQITVSHVLVSLNDAATNKAIRSDAEAKARAEEVYQKVTTGGDFAAIAKEYSDDPGSKDKGGSYTMPLADFKTQMVKEFAEAAVALKTGEITQPVKTQFGYHVIKLDKIEMPKGNAYKEQYKELADSLLTQKAQSDPKFQEWYGNLTKKAEEKAEILDPAMRAYRLKEKEKWAEAAVAYRKALKNSYYKNALDVQLDAATVYLKLKQADEALKILKQVPERYRADTGYQIALAKAYGANKNTTQAKSILTKLAKDNGENVQVLMQLKEAYTELKMTKEAAAQEALIKNIQKAQQEAMQKQLEEQQKAQAETAAEAAPAASPEASPEASPKKEEPKPSAKKK